MPSWKSAPLSSKVADFPALAFYSLHFEPGPEKSGAGLSFWNLPSGDEIQTILSGTGC